MRVFYSHNTLTSYWMESSPASFTATHVYLPVSSAWALGICNTRPPNKKKSERWVQTPFFRLVPSLSFCFLCLSHLAWSALCHLRSVAVRLCTRWVSEEGQRWSHSTERWDYWVSHPERPLQSLGETHHHQLHPACWNLVVLRRREEKYLNFPQFLNCYFIAWLEIQSNLFHTWKEINLTLKKRITCTRDYCSYIKISVKQHKSQVFSYSSSPLNTKKDLINTFASVNPVHLVYLHQSPSHPLRLCSWRHRCSAQCLTPGHTWSGQYGRWLWWTHGCLLARSVHEQKDQIRDKWLFNVIL